MHSAVSARKPMFIQKLPRAVKVNRQFLFKMQALAKTKKLLRLQIVKY